MAPPSKGQTRETAKTLRDTCKQFESPRIINIINVWWTYVAINLVPLSNGIAQLLQSPERDWGISFGCIKSARWRPIMRFNWWRTRKVNYGRRVAFVIKIFSSHSLSMQVFKDICRSFTFTIYLSQATIIRQAATKDRPGSRVRIVGHKKSYFMLINDLVVRPHSLDNDTVSVLVEARSEC